MKKEIIISINPEHVKSIFQGTKKYEYRTKTTKSQISKLIIYATAPIKRIVGEVEVLGVLSMSPKQLWEETKEHSGITKAFFDNYFNKRTIAYAYCLGTIKVYEKQKKLEEYGLRFAPRSFVYKKL